MVEQVDVSGAGQEPLVGIGEQRVVPA